MLENPQASLDNNVLKNGPGRNVNRGTLSGDYDDGALQSNTSAKVDLTANGQVVELENARDAGDAALEVRNLLEIRAQLDERCRSEAVGVHDELAVLERVEIRLDQHQIGRRLDRQEPTARHIDAVGVVEMADGSADCGLELDDRQVGLALLVGGDGLVVGDDFHRKLIVLNDALDGTEVHPDVVGVEVLELLDGLKLVDMLLGDLSNFKQASLALIIDNGTTLDIGFGFISQLHNVLGLGLDHVLENAQVNNGAQVVSVRQEDDLDSALKQLVERA